MKTALLSIGLLLAVVPHDFFVSILTIRHSDTKKTLDLTWQMTAHDVEHALASVAELKLASQQEHPKADSLLNTYFNQHLHLFQEDRELSWNWVGREMEGENLFCYMQVEGVHDANGLSVSNSLLQDVFAEQQNLVHVEGENLPTQSYTFGRGASPHSFTW